MKAAVYGRVFNPDFEIYARIFFEKLKKFGFETVLFQPFHKFMKSEYNFDAQPDSTFSGLLKKKSDIDLIFSIGGDGTFLETVSFVRDTKIPIVGINSGRLGFLANISKDELPDALELINKMEFQTEERTLIQVDSDIPVFSDFNCALNEITVQKQDSGSMITIHVHANGEFLNSYRADGLIISTPTGSTAYSLSLGGPIVVPGSKNFIITPIAPHNLTVRPMVIPDDMILEISIEGRNKNYLASLDFRSEILNGNTKLTVKSADFSIYTVKFNGKNFFDTLRKKLLWGLDSRN